MKLIGVYGGSGAGKSTTSNLLNQLIDNSVVIHLDPFMHKYIDEHTPELCQKLGINKVPEHFLSYISHQTGSNKFWIDEIRPGVEDETLKIIDCYADAEYIIIDWAFLAYSTLYDKCDFTILVESNEELKFTRLKARLAQNSKGKIWNEEQIRSRIRNSTIDCEGPTPSYTVLNDEEHSLGLQLTNIASSIVNSENISRKKSTL